MPKIFLQFEHSLKKSQIIEKITSPSVGNRIGKWGALCENNFTLSGRSVYIIYTYAVEVHLEHESSCCGMQQVISSGSNFLNRLSIRLINGCLMERAQLGIVRLFDENLFGWVFGNSLKLDFIV